MKIVLIENPETLAKCRSIAVANVLNTAREAQEVYLRRQFDIALISSTALATIDVAELLGYSDLAEEMRNDFYCATGKEAV